MPAWLDLVLTDPFFKLNRDEGISAELGLHDRVGRNGLFEFQLRNWVREAASGNSIAKPDYGGLTDSDTSQADLDQIVLVQPMHTGHAKAGQGQVVNRHIIWSIAGSERRQALNHVSIT